MQALTDRRKQLIRLIHVAKRDRALAEEDYRALLTRETGKASSADMTEAELDKVLRAFRASGFLVKHSAGRVKRPQPAPAPAPSRRAHRLRDGQAALITALWIDLWLLGAAHSNDDKAIDAFVKRQTGIERMQWLSPANANKVIEALKDWCRREGFEVPVFADSGLSAKRKLCEAIYAKLDDESRAEWEDDMLYIHSAPAVQAEKLGNLMGLRLRAILAERGE